VSTGSIAPNLPPSVRVELAHAATCRLAELIGADVLVLKGPRMDPTVGFDGRASSDVDILVRPTQLTLVLDALTAHGATALDRFETGSPFGHSTTFFSPVWGHLDVHRFVPGVELDPAAAFERLWADREEVRFGGIPGWQPGPAAQALVLVLHAARSGPEGRSLVDVDHAWNRATSARRAEILELVAGVQAEVAWAAATGGLEGFRGRASYRLWRAVSREEGRLAEWRGRVAAAPTWRAKATLLLAAPRVNVDHLAILLGRRPTRAEVAAEWRRRARLGAGELLAAARRGTRRRR